MNEVPGLEGFNAKPGSRSAYADLAGGVKFWSEEAATWKRRFRKSWLIGFASGALIGGVFGFVVALSRGHDGDCGDASPAKAALPHRNFSAPFQSRRTGLYEVVRSVPER